MRDTSINQLTGGGSDFTASDLLILPIVRRFAGLFTARGPRTWTLQRVALASLGTMRAATRFERYGNRASVRPWT